MQYSIQRSPAQTMKLPCCNLLSTIIEGWHGIFIHRRRYIFIFVSLLHFLTLFPRIGTKFGYYNWGDYAHLCVTFKATLRRRINADMIHHYCHRQPHLQRRRASDAHSAKSEIEIKHKRITVVAHLPWRGRVRFLNAGFES